MASRIIVKFWEEIKLALIPLARASLRENSVEATVKLHLVLGGLADPSHLPQVLAERSHPYMVGKKLKQLKLPTAIIVDYWILFFEFPQYNSVTVRDW